MSVSLAGIIPLEEDIVWLYFLQIQKKAGAQMKNMELGGEIVIDTEAGDASQPVDCWCAAVPCLEHQCGIPILLRRRVGKSQEL